MVDKYTVQKFKRKILEMSRGIPDYKFYGVVKDLVPDEEIREYFLKKEVFIKSKKKHSETGQDLHFLGIEGMHLASNYAMEEVAEETMKLTNKIKQLTIAIYVLTGFNVLLVIFAILK